MGMESTSLPAYANSTLVAANVASSSVAGNMDITSVLGNVDAISVVASVDSTTIVADVRPKSSSELTSSSSHVASELVSDRTIKTSQTRSTLKSPLSEYIPDLDHLKLSPSSLMTTTRTIPVISTSSLLRSTATSSAKIDWHFTAWTASPLQSTDFESHTIIASPTVTSIINTTVTATVPSTVHGNIQH